MKRNISSFTRAESTHLWAFFDEEIPEVVQKVTSAVRFGVDVLMEYGIDDIDDTMLANMVVQSGNIKESLGYIYAKAGEIQR